MNRALLDVLEKGPIEFRYPGFVIWVYRFSALLGGLLLLLFWWAFLNGSMGLSGALRIAELFALTAGTIGWAWYFKLFLPRTRQVLSVSMEGITQTAGPGSPRTLLWSDVGRVLHRRFAYTLDLTSRDGKSIIRVGGDVVGFQALKGIAESLS